MGKWEEILQRLHRPMHRRIRGNFMKDCFGKLVTGGYTPPNITATVGEDGGGAAASRPAADYWQLIF
jgi:hypothetical protein